MTVVPIGDNAPPPTQLVTSAGRVTAVIDRLPFFIDLAERVAQTEFVPKALKGRHEAVLAALLSGAELGLQPMQSLRSIAIIDGKPSLSAEVQRALVIAAGHHLDIVEQSATRAAVRGCRNGDSEWSPPFVWTIEMAKTAKLTAKDNWVKYPAAMLLARASTDCCRALFPDVIAGLAATEEVIDYDDVPRRAALPADDGGLEPDPIAAELADEDGRELRRLHAVMAETFPDDDTETVDRWRHALCAVITRKRDEPVTSSAELHESDRVRLFTLLAHVRQGTASLDVDDVGRVLVIDGSWRWRVTLDGAELQIETWNRDVLVGVSGATVNGDDVEAPWWIDEGEA